MCETDEVQRPGFVSSSGPLCLRIELEFLGREVDLRARMRILMTNPHTLNGQGEPEVNWRT